MGQRFEDENGIVDIIDDGISGGRAPANNFEDENGDFTLESGAGVFAAAGTYAMIGSAASFEGIPEPPVAVFILMPQACM